MLDGDGRVRITDFGLAGLAGEIKDIRAGTPAYMAPEQALGDLKALDERTDVFCLGSILVEILTGAPPYDSPGVREVRARAFRLAS